MKPWERNFNDICMDTGVIWHPSMTWEQCMELVFEKWNPLRLLITADMVALSLYQEQQLSNKTVGYMNDMDTCAFCIKAESISRQYEYGLNGATCAACILAGKCFDDAWIIKDIFIALRNMNWNMMRDLIKQGTSDVRDIVNGLDDHK